MIVKHRFADRHAASVLLALLALGVNAPIAGARPVDSGPARSFASASVTQPSTPSLRAAVMHSADSAISGWGYVAIGSGATSLALFSIGGTRAAGRRRRQRRTAQQPMSS